MAKTIFKRTKSCPLDKGPAIQSSFEGTTSFYRNFKDATPVLSVTSDGDFKISLIKLALMLVCALTAFVLAVLALKQLIRKIRARRQIKQLERTEGVWYYDDNGNLVWQRDPGEDLPF